MEFAGNGHPTHAGDLEVDYNRSWLLGADGFVGGLWVSVVDQGVVGFCQSGVDVIACPRFVCDDEDS